jgi:hypothetical protein
VRLEARSAIVARRAGLPFSASPSNEIYSRLEMSCLKGESKAKPKPGRYRCKDCGAVVKKKDKDKACDPKKIK